MRAALSRLSAALVIVIALMGVSLTSIGSTTAQDATPMAGGTPAADCPTTTPEENLAIAKRWFTDLPEGLADLVTDDFTIEPGMGADVQGREAVIGRLLAIAAAVPNSTHEYEVEATDGDKVILRWVGHGTFDAEYLGVQPTGEAVTLSGIHIFEIRCGKIAHIWAETNLHEVHLQLIGAGAAATPEATPGM